MSGTTTPCLTRKGLAKKMYRSQGKARQAVIRFWGTDYVKGTIRYHECPRCGFWP